MTETDLIIVLSSLFLFKMKFYDITGGFEMERTFEITRQFIKTLICDKCNVEMKAHAPAISLAPGAPKRYTFKCPNCGYMETTEKPYPLTMFHTQEVFESAEEGNNEIPVEAVN